jgi:hypothetical protein
MIELSSKWVETLVSQPETGMSYTVCTVRLTDGRVFEGVVIVGGIVTRCDGQTVIPFDECSIASITATHDKSALA